MSATTPGRAAPPKNYAAEIIEEVRAAIAPEKWVLAEAKARRNKVAAAAAKFHGTRDPFPSGSLAHATVNNPVQDGDLGLPLDRRTWRDLGPDGRNVGAGQVKAQIAAFVADELCTEYPQITSNVTDSRAILFEFHAPMDDEDPSVDLMLCLERVDRPGFWIPKKHGGWDASHPLEHTRLMNNVPDDLRAARAQTIRLVKAAVNQDGDDGRVLIPWNISALALYVFSPRETRIAALEQFLEAAAYHLASYGPTSDPAKVSDPIKLPHGQERAVTRLRYFAQAVGEAAANGHDRDAALRALSKVFPEQLRDAPKDPRDRFFSAAKTGNHAPVIAAGLGAQVHKTPRSFGSGA